MACELSNLLHTASIVATCLLDIYYGKEGLHIYARLKSI